MLLWECCVHQNPSHKDVKKYVSFFPKMCWEGQNIHSFLDFLLVQRFSFELWDFVIVLRYVGEKFLLKENKFEIVCFKEG